MEPFALSTVVARRSGCSPAEMYPPSTWCEFSILWSKNLQARTLTTKLNTNTLDVDTVRLGPQGSLPSGTQGTLYFDSFISRTSFYQGLGNEISSGPSSFSYDGNGQRVKATVNGVTTVYIGNWYEKTGTVVKKYYDAGSNRVALSDNGTVKYLFGDHLGSTNVIADANGVKQSENLYKPWGEDRYSSGTLATTFGFTGQRAERSVAGGLYFYNTRYYDPNLSRFASADTIIPGASSPIAWDRYSYSYNNPLNYVDPTGHWPDWFDKAVDALDYLITVATATTEYIIQNPPVVDNLTVNIPVVVPGGLGQSPSILNYSADLTYLRSGGRVVGDTTIPLTVPIGIALTNAPNQLENISQGAPWNDYLGDFLVDTMGWGVSEAAGTFAGLITSEIGPVCVPIKIIADVGVGIIWDGGVEQGFRNETIDQLGSFGNLVSRFNNLVTPVNPSARPVQTPPSRPKIKTTPNPY